MDTQPISNCCPKCHSPLPVDAPQGLCPKCLFAAVATPTEAGQPAGHRATPPAVEEIAAAFPQLEILEFIGQGGMGLFFKPPPVEVGPFFCVKNPAAITRG